MLSKNYISYHISNKYNCHIDAVHAIAPDSDEYTGPHLSVVCSSGSGIWDYGLANKEEFPNSLTLKKTVGIPFTFN